MEMDDHKRRRNMILYIIIAFMVYLVLNTVLFPNMGQQAQITEVSYTTLLDDLEKGDVDKIDYTTGEYDASTRARATPTTSPTARPSCPAPRTP